MSLEISYAVSVSFTTPDGMLTASINVDVADATGSHKQWATHVITWTDVFNDLCYDHNSFKNSSPAELTDIWFKAIAHYRNELMKALDAIVQQNILIQSGIPRQSTPVDQDRAALAALLSTHTNHNN